MLPNETEVDICYQNNIALTSLFDCNLFLLLSILITWYTVK